MKTEFVREYKRKIRLILISKLNGKNKTKAINSWTVAIIRYGAGVLEWKFDKLKELDRKTRKVKKIILDGTFRIRMKIASRNEACQDSEVQRECLKERLQKIAE